MEGYNINDVLYHIIYLTEKSNINIDLSILIQALPNQAAKILVLLSVAKYNPKSLSLNLLLG